MRYRTVNNPTRTLPWWARAVGQALLVAALVGGGLQGLTAAGAASGPPRRQATAVGTPPPPRGEVSSGAWAPDLDAVRDKFAIGGEIESIEDLYRVRVRLPAGEIVSDVLLFGPVRVVPYADTDAALDVEGRPAGRGDAALAELFPAGSIGLAIKHRRGSHRVLEPPFRSGISLREEVKLHETHLMMVVGVERAGAPGVVTLSSPPGYESGRFGSQQYPMVFVRPVFPDYLTPEQVAAYRDNIRTVMLGLTALAKLPSNYSGGDPLSVTDIEGLRQMTAQMVRAVAGDEAARSWFREPDNNLYCGELALVALSAGLHVPLNASTLVPLVGEEVFERFQAQVGAQNRGEQSGFSIAAANPEARWIEVAIAPESLRPILEIAPPEVVDDKRRSSDLVFPPLTRMDMIELFVRLHVPREKLGEERGALLQGQLMNAMRPWLPQVLGIDKLAPDDPLLAQLEATWGRAETIVATPHASYAAFRAELDPVLAELSELVARGTQDARLLAPPSLFAVVAQGLWGDGLLDLEYVAHGLHVSMMRRQ